MQIVLDTLIVTTDLLISIIVKNKAEFKKKKTTNHYYPYLHYFIECIEYVFHQLSQDISEYELETLNKMSKEQGKIHSPAAASAYEYLMNSWKEQKQKVEFRKLF